MLQRSASLLAVALAATFAPVALRAQVSPNPTITIGGSFGGFSGAAHLDQSGSTKWRIGWAGTADATLWLHQYVGVRASGGWAQDSITNGISGRGTFNKFTYDGDLVLRYPLQAGSSTVVPYVLGGAGAVSIHQLGSTDTWTKFAGNFGAGLEYRFGRLGVRAEGRDYIYTFDAYGFDKTQHDVAWQGGITVSF
jgi:hypothetical protein